MLSKPTQHLTRLTPLHEVFACIDAIAKPVPARKVDVIHAAGQVLAADVMAACPLPALKARKALSRLASGDLLVLECTDPLSAIDIPNLVRETGDVLEQTARDAKLFVFRIRKA